VYHQSTTVPPFTSGFLLANCPGSQQVIGGGADAGSNALQESHPVWNGSRWSHWAASTFNGGPASATFDVWVICADV
jgi:hypothetical protein